MCDIIVLKDGRDLHTVADFEKEFNVVAENFRYEDEPETEIIRDSCLCQIDIEDFLTSKGFERDYGLGYIEGGWNVKGV